MVDFDQTYTETPFGHRKEMSRFWWPWPHFQGHTSTLNVKVRPNKLVCTLSLEPNERSSLIRVYTVCNSGCIFWVHYSSVKPSCSNFRVITANFLGVRIFRIFTVLTAMFLNFHEVRSKQTVQTQSLHCLPFRLHLLDLFLCNKTIPFQFEDNYSSFSGVRIFRKFTILNFRYIYQKLKDERRQEQRVKRKAEGADGDSTADNSKADRDNDDDDDSVDLSVVVIVIFFILVCAFLVLLYFFYDYLGKLVHVKRVLVIWW